MPAIKLETMINAPIERVFDLARSIDLHAETMSRNRELAVDGVMAGLIDEGQTVTWEAVHFGVRQRLTSRITICDWPVHLQDVMVHGAFTSFTHDHYFLERDNCTLMKDEFDYKSPLGILGRIANSIFLQRYMTNLLADRNQMIKLVAESDRWQKFLPEGLPSL